MLNFDGGHGKSKITAVTLLVTARSCHLILSLILYVIHMSQNRLSYPTTTHTFVNPQIK